MESEYVQHPRLPGLQSTVNETATGKVVNVFTAVLFLYSELASGKRELGRTLLRFKDA